MTTLEILKQSKELLFQLGNSVSKLISDYQDIIGDSLIIEKLDHFKIAYEEAVQRLENPSLRLATIGTTSSGKSTLVNALIGRKIAPIESEEMSAGVLLLKHGEQTELVIKETQSAYWENGIWSDLDDAEIYSRIKSVMQTYHMIRNDRKQSYTIEIPEVVVTCPLLPGCDKRLIGLPEGIDIEIIDLPGLKSIQDRENLRIIQERVSKSFSLVALDYAQVDDEHRKALLKELKEVVEYLRGRTDLMIFLLNRVDLRDESSLPLQERINKLQDEIQKELNLLGQPNVIPFSAQILFYAQCAWGSSSDEYSSVDQESRRIMLSSMLRDCAKPIKQFTQKDKELRKWFRDIEDDIDDGLDIDDKTTRKLLDYAMEWSGGKQLWSLLQQRIDEAFPKLIISPAIIDVVGSAKGISSALKIIIETKRLQTIQEVDKQKKSLILREKELKIETDKLLDLFIKNIEELTKDLKKSNPNDASEVAKNAKTKGIEGLNLLIDLIDDEKKDLMETVISPVRDMLINNKGAYQLEDELSKSLPKALANQIARASDCTSRMLSEFSSQDRFLIMKVENENLNKLRKLEKVERVVLTLYQNMRDALESRAEFFLQSRVQAFESVGNSLIKMTRERMLSVAMEKSGNLSVGEVVMLELDDYFRNHPLTLPEGKVFVFPEPVKRETNQEEEFGEKEYLRKKSCFGGVERVTVRESSGVRTYQALRVPDYNQMAKQWITGLEQGEDVLWKTLKNWLIEYMTEIKSVLQKSANNITRLALVELDKQKLFLESELESGLGIIDKLETQREEIENSVKSIDNLIFHQEE
jgi:GTPase SAR1 family protein